MRLCGSASVRRGRVGTLSLSRQIISKGRYIFQTDGARVVDGKEKRTTGSSRRAIGWPLCSARTVVIHVGDISLRGANKHLLPLRTGDFYLCVHRKDSNFDQQQAVEVSFALRWFDATRDDFAQVAVDPEQLADWVRSSPSTTFLGLPAGFGCRLNLSNCLLMDAVSGLVERRPLCWTAVEGGCATLSLVDEHASSSFSSAKWGEEEPGELLDMTRRSTSSTPSIATPFLHLSQTSERRQTPGQ